MPSVVAQWIFALYTMVDGMFVARGVSEVALAAVNIASPYVHFLFSVSILLAVGTSTIIAIYLGQTNHQKANQAYSQNLVVLSVISGIIMLLAWIFLDDIAVFLGATAPTMEYVKEYIGSILPFSWCFTIAYSFELLVKTDGYPRFATIAVTSGAVMNCVLDYLFVIEWNWGVKGAGWATGISQLALIFIYLWHFLSPRATIRLARFKWNIKEMLRTVKLGASSGLTEFSAGITIFLFNHAILSHIGEEGIVSYTIIAYINTIVVMSLAGVAQGMQPLASYYYGKGDHTACQTLLRYGLVTSMGFGILSYLVVLVGAEWIVALFVSPELVALREFSASVFRVFSLSFLIMGFNVLISGYFTAVEKPAQSLIISLGRGLVILFVALEVCVYLFGGAGIWWSALVSEVLCLGVTLFLLLQHKHKTRKEIVA